MHLRSIEENSSKPPAATQEVSTPPVLPLDTDRYGCLLLSELRAPRCQLLSLWSEGNSLLGLCAPAGHPRAHPTPPPLQVESTAAEQHAGILGNPGLASQTTELLGNRGLGLTCCCRDDFHVP